MIIPRKVFDPWGEYNSYHVVCPCMSASGRPESDLRDGSMEFNDLLDSDEQLPDTGAHL